ncbi:MULTISPECIES: alpha/beta hydrolase [Microbacterium]|uniref:Alpha/beta hydrolase n=1 Tax=Microbacterium wangchenii TaxID=2541726 RepID=A0ABX5SRC9_9MICO|nr:MULTISPECIES: alpha/beta fold hydrolase [Microbacterium]MCK6066453.1 alpha/beta fold hydrolase [Microbacterium sp. EYE_512]QBR87414.1 hypothetical protein E4K62_01070 [Microbacterium wangchenii]TXK14736.1 hypothetical protein FVP99_13650 [Microbacterium wangchenii]
MLTVLLHGRGGSERDMQPIAARLPGRTLCLRASHVRGKGFGWFDWRGRPPHVDEATGPAEEVLRVIEDEAADDEPVTAIGWSEGSTLIVEVMRLRPARIAKAVLGTGFPVAGNRPTDLELARLRPPTYWVTGDSDDVIPADAEGAEFRRFLDEHTALHATVLTGVGHELRGGMNEALVARALA